MKGSVAVLHSNKKTNTFKKIYFSYFFLCLIPFAIIAFALIASTQQALQKEAKMIQAHTAESIVRTFDNDINTLQNIKHQLSETVWVKKRGSTSDIFEDDFDFYLKRSICNDLRSYTVTSNVIRTLSVVFPSKKEVYSSNGYYNTEDFFHSFSLLKGQTPLECDTVYDNIKVYKDMPLVSGKQLGMTREAENYLFYILPIENDNYMRSFIFIQINTSSIYNTLSLLRTDDLTAFHLNSKEQNLLPLIFSQAKNTQTLFKYSSSCLPIEYTLYFEREDVFKTNQIMLVVLLLLGTLFLIINLSFFLTKMSYKPIKNLIQIISKTTPLPYEQQNDYQMIEQSLYQLSEEKDNVLKIANQYRATAKTNFLCRLLQGYFNIEGAQKKMQEFDIELKDSMYHTVFLIDMSNQMGKVPSAPFLVIEEVFSKNDYLYEMYEFSKTRVAVILGIEEAQKEGFSPEQIKEQIISIYTVQVECAPNVHYGTLEKGILGIGKSYYSANEMSAHVPSGNILSLYKDFYYPTEWELQLINHVKSGQEKLAQQILEEIRSENEKKQLSLVKTKQLVQMLAQTYSKIINEFDVKTDKYNAVYEKIQRSSSVDEMWSALFSINQQICTKKMPDVDLENTQRQIVQYIKENLTDPDLSLKDLGTRFNLSVSAISKIFKRTCGINFYDFLLSNRMNLALEMMKNNQFTLSSISRAVGYENDYSFKRAFSRFYGMSITEYLKSQKREEQGN